MNHFRELWQKYTNIFAPRLFVIQIQIQAVQCLTLNVVFQVLDLPYERMPPRKDAPATPEDTSSGSALADGGNGEAPKANNSNG